MELKEEVQDLKSSQILNNIIHLNDDLDESILSDEYEVDCILDKKTIRGKDYYRVYWKGYSLEESTWEPIENLTNCEVKIKEYEEFENTFLKKKFEKQREYKKTSKNNKMIKEEDDIDDNKSLFNKTEKNGNLNYKIDDNDSGLDNFSHNITTKKYSHFNNNLYIKSDPEKEFENNSSQHNVNTERNDNLLNKVYNIQRYNQSSPEVIRLFKTYKALRIESVKVNINSIENYKNEIFLKIRWENSKQLTYISNLILKYFYPFLLFSFYENNIKYKKSILKSINS